MALDFGLLQTNDLGAQFNAGRDAVQNQLARQQMLQLQRQQIQGQAEDRAAEAEKRRADAEARRQAIVDAKAKSDQLKAIEDEFARNGQQLTPAVAAKMIATGHPVYTQIGAKALEGYQSREMLRGIFGGDTGAAPTAPQTPQAQPMMVSDTPGQPAVRVQGATPISTNTLTPTAGPTQNALAFDIPGAQAKITRLLATGDPALVQVAHGLQQQVAAEQTRQNQLRVDERQRARDEQMAADREEARALRRELAAGRRAAGDGGDAGKGTLTVRDETGKITTVTKADAVRRGLVEVKNDTQMTPQEIQKREALFPKAKQAVTTVESNMDTLAQDLEKLANHPGLNGITGLVYGRTPSVTAEARAAQALYDKIVARGGFSELQNMRAASPTGGALGNVSDREGQQLKQSFAEIGREQSTKDVKAALLRAAENARQVKARAREAFDDTYEYRNQGGSAPAKPAATKTGATVSNW